MSTLLENADVDNSTEVFGGEYYQARSHVPGQGPCFPVWLGTVDLFNRCVCVCVCVCAHACVCVCVCVCLWHSCVCRCEEGGGDVCVCGGCRWVCVHECI